MRITALLAACAATVMMAGAAKAGQQITYGGGYSDQFGDSVSFDITTDGTMGALAPSDIVAFQIESPQYFDGSFNSLDGNVYFSDNMQSGSDGGDLTASATAISFNFSDITHIGDVDFSAVDDPDYPPDANIEDALCFQNDNACGGYEGDDVFEETSYGGGHYGPDYQPSTDVIATVDEVVSFAPEPATWTMLILGASLAGTALRRQRRVQA